MIPSMTDGELKQYCESAKVSFKLISPPYWTAEIYGFGKWIRKYGYYPSFLPLCIFTDHGPAQTGVISPHELESDAPTQFYHSPNCVNTWKKVSRKRCKVLLSPFAFCRKMNRIEVMANARGTLAFPAHTTDSINDHSDLNIYINQLKKLPEEYQPVAVCLHPTDIKNGREKIFKENGLPVYTAGNSLDDRFTERFYEIIKHFKFTTSNIIGAYTYYAVEMGLPFFLYGNGPGWVNYSDKNIPLGPFNPYLLYQDYRTVHDLFSSVTHQISTEQKNYILRELGILNGISRFEMAFTLYLSFIEWLINYSSIKYLILDFQTRLGRALKRINFFSKFNP